MSHLKATNNRGSWTDDDSGVDLNSSSSTLHRRTNVEPLVKFVSRVRPATMKNSTNGDYILCHTDRGNFVAYRTPAVPAWVTRLVEEIELLQR